MTDVDTSDPRDASGRQIVGDCPQCGNPFPADCTCESVTVALAVQLANEARDATDRLERARHHFNGIRSNIARLYDTIGAHSSDCRGCGATIWWITTKNGKSAPMTADALNHHVDCPDADRFRRR